MGIRESLNKNPSITTGFTIGIIVLALGAIIWQMRSGSSRYTIQNAYYTVDDGKTWFEDLGTKNPPIDHNGQLAVRCLIFKCGENGAPFVAYLERFTPEALKKMEAAAASKAPPETADIDLLYSTGMEVKRPGSAKWIPRASPEGDKICDVKCPDGSSGDLRAVLPGL